MQFLRLPADTVCCYVFLRVDDAKAPFIPSRLCHLETYDQTRSLRAHTLESGSQR